MHHFTVPRLVLLVQARLDRNKREEAYLEKKRKKPKELSPLEQLKQDFPGQVDA